MRRAPLEGAQGESEEGTPSSQCSPGLPAGDTPLWGTEVGPGEIVGGGCSLGLRVRIQGTARDPGGVSAHGYLEGCQRSARSGPGHTAAAPHAARGFWGPLGRAGSRLLGPGAQAGAGPRGPLPGFLQRASDRDAHGRAREACELHLNGRPAHRARQAGFWAAGMGRATSGARRQRGRAPAFCNLLRLLPRLAPGSAGKG